MKKRTTDFMDYPAKRDGFHGLRNKNGLYFFLLYFSYLLICAIRVICG